MLSHPSQTIDTEALRRELTELDRLLHHIKERIVNAPAPLDARQAILKRTAGILKNKIMEDPVEWQRKIRAEWD